jgi:hypothetical protein
LAVALTGASSAHAADGGAVPADRATPALSARRHHEADELRRRDLARELEARGVAVRWDEHDPGELLDWRERIDAARALEKDFGVLVEWRAETAQAMTDMRLCATKAKDMQATFGILVDWRRYTWTQLERLRLSLVAIHPTAAGPDRWSSLDGKAQATRRAAPDRDGLAPFDPNRRTPRLAGNPHDPDAILAPLFASALATPRARTGQPEARNPDAIVAPTFPRGSRRANVRDRDSLINPFDRE